MTSLFQLRLQLSGLPDDPYTRLDAVEQRMLDVAGVLDGEWKVQLDRDGPVVEMRRRGRVDLDLNLFPGWEGGDEDPTHFTLWATMPALNDLEEVHMRRGFVVGTLLSGVISFGLYSFVPLGFQLAWPIALLGFFIGSFVLSITIGVMSRKASRQRMASSLRGRLVAAVDAVEQVAIV